MIRVSMSTGPKHHLNLQVHLNLHQHRFPLVQARVLVVLQVHLNLHPRLSLRVHLLVPVVLHLRLFLQAHQLVLVFRHHRHTLRVQV